ncbi:hypothetical protein BpHYR1_004815, partial [Brachionus plicatilis]
INSVLCPVHSKYYSELKCCQVHVQLALLYISKYTNSQYPVKVLLRSKFTLYCVISNYFRKPRIQTPDNFPMPCHKTSILWRYEGCTTSSPFIPPIAQMIPIKKSMVHNILVASISFLKTLGKP